MYYIIMKKVILLGGVLAAGKSTYAQILKEKFNITTITKDRLKEILGDNIYAENRAQNKALSSACFDIFKYLIKQSTCNLLFECNFKPHELVLLNTLCNENGYKVLSIVCDADNEILHKRFIKRLGDNRHYVHKSQDFTDINDFIPVLDELRSAPYFGQIIRVNCNDFTYQKDQALLDGIEQFLND